MRDTRLRENTQTTQSERFSGNYAGDSAGNGNRNEFQRTQGNAAGTEAESSGLNRILKRTGLAFLGVFIAALIALSTLNSTSVVDTSDAAVEALEKGESAELKVGTRLLMKDQQMPGQDHIITHSSKKDTSELHIWDYAAEDGDYVQVLVDDVPLGDPFMIKNKPVTLTIPSSGVVKVLGTRDGGGGITYAVRYDLNSITYFNGMNEGEGNLYTLIRE